MTQQQPQQPAYNISVFDEHALRYDGWFPEHRAAFESELALLRSLMVPAAAAVEIGAGSGRFGAALRIAVAVEPAAAMARLAQGRGLAVIRAMAEQLPLRDAHYGLVLVVTALCFFADPAAALREIRRILAPGGRLVVGFLDAASPGGRKLESRKKASPFYARASLHTAAQVEDLLRNSGFVVERCLQTLFRDPEQLTGCDSIEAGHGDGLFVAMRCRARNLQEVQR